MPRPTMPTYFKNMESYSVQLTKTSEEDLKEHFCKSSERYTAKVEADIDEQRRLLKMLYNENPYNQKNWRKGSPERLYKDGFDKKSLRDEKANELKWQLDIQRDFKWAMDVYKWEEDWAVELMQFIYRSTERYKSNFDEIKHMDLLCFETAKQNWEVEDAEWITNQKLKKAHESHKPKSYWIDLFATDKQSEKWCKGVIPDNEDTCKFCIEEKRISDEREEKMRLEEEQQEREEEERREERRLLEEEKKRQRQAVELITQQCKECNYTTNHSAMYQIHITSKQHLINIKKQSLFCKACEHQSRTEIEHAHHLTTTKHKKNTGLVDPEPEEYHCKCCDYKTPLKQNMAIHMKSKKHKTNVAEKSS